jgi:LysM repeat protein
MRKVVMLAVLFTVLGVLALPMCALAEHAQVAGDSGCARFYTVRRGDTLSGIARTYGATVSYLTSINGIANPNQIAAGTTICVRAQGGQPTGFHYTVRPGDTLYAIARRFGWTADCLAQVNGMPNPNELYAGRVLWIPAH